MIFTWIVNRRDVNFPESLEENSFKAVYFLKVWRKIHSNLVQVTWKKSPELKSLFNFVPACRTLAPLLTASFVVFQESSHSQWHWINYVAEALQWRFRSFWGCFTFCSWNVSSAIYIYIYICMGMYVYMYLACLIHFTCWEKLWRFCDEFYSFLVGAHWNFYLFLLFKIRSSTI